MDEPAGGQRPPLNFRRALSPTGNAGDAVFRALMFGAALLVLLIVGSMILALASHSKLSIREFGFGFLTSREWNPIKGQFGALAFIYGTIASSLIALLISVPLSLGIAIFLVEQAPHFLARPITFLVELLAAIPSVVYGLWGIFVLAPFLRVHVEPLLARWFGWLPLFQGPITGIGLLTGGVILAIMVTPIISAVVRDVLSAVPNTQREAALALGGNKMGDHAGCFGQRRPRNRRRGDPWPRSRDWRNDGGDDGDRQPPGNQRVAVSALVHIGLSDRE